MGTTTCKDWRPDLPAPALQSSHHRPLPGSSRLYHLQCPPLSSAAPPRGAQPPHCLRAHAMPKSRLIYGTIPTRTAPAAYRPPRVYLRRSRVRSPVNRTDRVACGCVQVSGARAEAPGGGGCSAARTAATPSTTSRPSPAADGHPSNTTGAGFRRPPVVSGAPARSTSSSWTSLGRSPRLSAPSTRA